jgi:hypothetical protein
LVTSQLATVLGAFIFLHFKHFLCDYVLQNDYQRRAKRSYGEFGGALHALVHALATTPVFFLLGPSLGLALAVVAAELFFHYHIDWLKERILAEGNWGPEDKAYWRTFGVDQMLHNLTYVGIVAVTS